MLPVYLLSARATQPGVPIRWRDAAAGWRELDDWGEERWAWRRIVLHFAIVAGVSALCVGWGLAVALTGYDGLIFCTALTACVFILIDFRVGVVLLILLMPVSASSVFPHAMGGITGLNPLNLLLAATLGSYVLQRMSERTEQRAGSGRLAWVYVLPIVAAGVIGSFHVDEIAAYFYMHDMVEFSTAGGYLRDVLLKPLFSFAGGGIVFAPSDEQLRAIPAAEHDQAARQDVRAARGEQDGAGRGSAGR